MSTTNVNVSMGEQASMPVEIAPILHVLEENKELIASNPAVWAIICDLVMALTGYEEMA